MRLPKPNGLSLCFAVFLGCLFTFPTQTIVAQTIPETDRRLTEIRHLDLTYAPREYKTKEEWLARSEALKKQILASAGLLPMPPKIPINPTIFGKVDRGDFTIEKVYFETYPGFYVTGNLYKPKNITGKLPAVLCPHGHWTYGRFENSPLNSGPARAASFARQGYVAFIYDMVGYGDSAGISHKFAINHREGVVDRETLWGVNLLGLQLWNSIRSIDFLLGLPEVDPDRIACTGESGGGTQTFLLMAVDERIKVAAPVNMISFIMQGGSLCENAPNLRIDTNNVELGALMAPRPLMMVSATGDWTKNTMSSEFPAVRNIYRLFGAGDKVTAVQMNAPHNYNQDSREAVYGWFAHWLLGRAETGPIKERGGAVAPLSDLMVFFGRPRPANEIDEARLSANLIAAAQKQVDESMPKDPAALASFRESFGESLKYSLMVENPDPGRIVASESKIEKLKGMTKEEFVISRRGIDDRIPVVLWRQPVSKTPSAVVMLVNMESGDNDMALKLIAKGYDVASIKLFPGGRVVPPEIKFFTTYNRTDEANRIQDILTAASYLKNRYNNSGLNLVARGQAGLLALLASGFSSGPDHLIVDAGEFDNTTDNDFMKRLPIPGIRRAGDLTTAVAISKMGPLFIYNTGNKFNTERIESIYRTFGRAADIKIESKNIDDSVIIDWLSSERERTRKEGTRNTRK